MTLDLIKIHRDLQVSRIDSVFTWMNQVIMFFEKQ